MSTAGIKEKSRFLEITTLRSKLLLGLIVLIFALGLGIVVLIRTSLSRNLTAELIKRGLSIARDFSSDVIDHILTENRLGLQLALLEHKRSEEDIEYIFVLNPDGKVLASTFGEAFPSDLKKINNPDKDQLYNIQPLITEKGKVFDIAVPLLKGELGFAHIGMSAKPVMNGVRESSNAVALIILGVVLVGSGFVFFFITTITKPLSEFTRAAREVGSGNLRCRVAINTKDEIGELAETFNKMVSELERTTVWRSQLEREVKERTLELTETNRNLQMEISERLAAEGALGRSRAEFEAIFNSISDSVIFTDINGRILLVNPAFSNMFGYDFEELQGKIADFLHIDMKDYEETVQKLHLAAELSKDVKYEMRFRRKHGTTFLAESLGIPVRDLAGDLIGFLSIHRDITERKRVEHALLESEERFRSLFNLATDGIILMKPMLGNWPIIADANIAACVMHGYSREELIGKPITFLDEAESAERARNITRRLITGENPTFEVTRVRKDGSMFPVEVSARMLHIEGKAFILSIERDITERKRAERELLLFQTLINRSNDAISVAEPETARFLYVNDKLCGNLGYSREELLGMTVLDVEKRFRNISDWKNHVEDVRKDGYRILEGVHMSKDLKTFPIEANVKFVSMDRKNYLVAVVRDLSERKKAEQMLRESEEKYKNLVELTTDIIYVSDKEGNHIFMNDASYKMLETTSEEVIGKPWITWIHPDDRERSHRIFTDILNQGINVFNYENRYVSKEGRVIHVLHNIRILRDEKGEVSGVQGIARDITERKHAEEQISASLREKEVLLKEIHHRVKNNLQVISSLLSLQSEYAGSAQSREMFHESRNRVRTMAIIHEKLYQSKDLAHIDLEEYIRSLIDNLVFSYGRPEIISHVAVENLSLEIDAAIPVGLIINELVSNSLKHAFPGRKKGEIRTEVRRLSKDEVELIVADNGIGIPEEIDVRSAASLGLHLVATLSEKQLKGRVELNTNGGTEFRIRFKWMKWNGKSGS